MTTLKVSKPLITIPCTAPIDVAAKLMAMHQIRHLVVTEDKQSIGVISDRDIQRASRVHLYRWGDEMPQDRSFDPSHRVCDFMSVPITSLDITASVSDVAAKMLAQRISSVILTNNGEAAGIVTTEDILRLLVEQGSITRHRSPTQVIHQAFDAIRTPIGSFLTQFEKSDV